MARLNRVLLYVKDIEKTSAFYSRHFGFVVKRDKDDSIVELICPEGGAILMLHPAAKGKKEGQTFVKLVFDVADVPGFSEKCQRDGLTFGPLHHADGYVFANAKDPSGNSISVSSRSFRHDD